MVNAPAPAHQALAYLHAADLPEEVWHALFRIESTANIVLSFARKALHFSRDGVSEQLWVVLYDNTNNVEFVLSCTTGPLGTYPIFIVACKPSAQLAEDTAGDGNLADSMLPLVLRLLEHVPPQRVFSVFAIAKVARRFARIFEALTGTQHGIRILETPYYDATFSFCTRETLRRPSEAVTSFGESEGIAIALRRADMSHLREIATMCRQFSETSPPFVLDPARAELEAKALIANQQVWVHLVQKEDQAPEIACLVATTRESDNVSAVTKVFTTEAWRGRGCAARLMHRVCHELLQKKKRVVLYVGNSDELAPARKVYHKIGFQGLNPQQNQRVPGVERWLEIGFASTVLGYW